MAVEFISYDGEYPHLCCGTVVLCIDGKRVLLEDNLIPTGSACSEDDDDGCYEPGPWIVKVPKEYAQYTKEIHDVVNANIEWGHCGGCM